MTLRFPNFEVDVEQRPILARGQSMYEEDYVKEAHSTDTNSWVVHVASERDSRKLYKVRIKFDGTRVQSARCNCPYRQGKICKHIVASLYHIRENEALVVSESDEEEDSLEEDEGDSFDESASETSSGRKSLSQKSRQSKKNKKTEVKETKKEEEMRELPNVSLQDVEYVDKEFHCQICLGSMDEPVSMPCHAHSLCYECALMLFKHQRKEAKGHKLLCCPTCREGSGVLKVRKPTDFKVNLEMKRIKEAYEKERKIWMKEKEVLEEKAKQSGQENAGKTEREEKKENKGDKRGIEEEIEKMDMSKLEELVNKAFLKFQANGMSASSIIEKFEQSLSKSVFM